MKKLLLFVLIACTNPERARETLAAHGFTNIEITGYATFACSRGDSTCTGFEATSPGGQRVTGAVGCGRGGCKGCTVRLD